MTASMMKTINIFMLHIFSILDTMHIFSAIVFTGLVLVAITYGQGAGGGHQKHDRYNNRDDSHSSYGDRNRYPSGS